MVFCPEGVTHYCYLLNTNKCSPVSLSCPDEDMVLKKSLQSKSSSCCCLVKLGNETTTDFILKSVFSSGGWFTILGCKHIVFLLICRGLQLS